MSGNVLNHTFPVTHINSKEPYFIPENLKLNTLYRYKGFTFSFHKQSDNTILTDCPILERLNSDYILLGGIDIQDAYQQLMEIIQFEIKKRRRKNECY